MNDRSDSEIVALVYEQWQQHFVPPNANALAALYAEDAVLFGSQIPPYIGRVEIESYFANLTPGLYTGVMFMPEYIKRPTSDVISIAGSVQFQRHGHSSLDLRITHILVRQDHTWLIASHHVSPKVAL